jgi:hypothetical protein
MKQMLLSGFCLAAFFCCGQEKLIPLKAPTSPAASILDMQPGTVLAPKSYSALEAALFSNFSNDEGATVPDDFGLEFSPYWATKEGLTLEDYLNPDNPWEEVVRNSSFSLASTQNFLLEDDTKTKSLAFGYRTSIFFGNSNDYQTTSSFVSNLAAYQRINAFILAQVDINQYSTKDGYLGALHPLLVSKLVEIKKMSLSEAMAFADKVVEAAMALDFDESDKNAFQNEFVNLLDLQTKIGEHFEEFKTYLKNRHGLTTDFAYATFVNFPDNDFKFSEVPRQSAWFTPSYRFGDGVNWLKVLGVVRYQWYYKHYFEKYFPDTKVYDHNLDYGVAIEGEFKKFSLRFELTGRTSSSLEESGLDPDGNVLYRKISEKDTQYIGTFTYNLTDKIALSYQIGSQFKPVFTGAETLVSLLSLNFGFGGPNKSGFLPDN